MKGFAMLSIGRTGWIEKPVPDCGVLDALVRPIALAPCTSDVHTVWEGALGPRENMILGHEAVGEVVQVGSLVKDFRRGDRVCVPAITPDWGSGEAQEGFAMHSGGMLAGWQFSNTGDGVFSEVFRVPQADANLAHLPMGVSPEQAVLLSDMIPTGFHAAELAQIGFGDSVCVIGIGPVGLMSVAACALRGASEIYAAGSRKVCMEAARGYGATELLDYHRGSLSEQVMVLTHGRGVDRVILAGGGTQTFAEAIRMLRPGGVAANVNYLGTGESIPIPRVEWGCGMGHKTIRGGLMPGGRRRLEKLGSLLSCGRLDPSPLVTHLFRGFEKVEDALQLMKEKPADLIKPVVLTE